MKPRIKQQDEDQGLDSLLDTMTNVVGILVLVLIVTQLGVSDKVASIAASSTVTEEDLDQAHTDLESQTNELAELRQQAAAASDINIEAERQRLQRMNQQLAVTQQDIEQRTQAINEYSLKIESDQKQAKELEQEIKDTAERRNELDAAIKEALTKRAELSALLDNTRRRPAPKKTEIRIPNPRPAPEGAKEATFICTKERLFPLRLEDHRRYAEQAGKQIITAQRLNLDPAAGIDPVRFTELFTKLPSPASDEFFTAEYYVANERWPRIRFRPNEQNGAPLRALTRPGTNIRKLITSINPQQFFCRFHVLPDSYDVYIAARRAVTNQNLLAGWEPQPENWTLTTSVPGIELGPPRPKPPPPANPQPRKVPNVID